MSISFVGSSFVANGLAQGTSAVVPRPPGVVDGDRLLAFISIGHSGAIAAPAGWAEVPLTDVAFATLQSRIYTKVASSEPVSWTWTFTSAAYAGIVHATRGVGGIFAADQDDDGISLLVHTTPTLPAPADAWLVSSWTGRNLLALGWSPPAGDAERQDVVGGLLILLNVNHAVDDTNGPVAAGSYNKSAATLVAVRAFDALVVLAPTLDPVQLQPTESPVSFGDVRVQGSIQVDPVLCPVTFGSLSIGHTLTLTDILSPFMFGVSQIEHTATLDSFIDHVTFGLFGVDPEVIMEQQLVPLVFGEFVAELELVLAGAIDDTVDFGEYAVDLNLELQHLDTTVDIADDFLVLPEQTILLDPGLPVPIIAGSGGIPSVFRTALLAEPFLFSPVTFGRSVIYTEQPYGGICCPTDAS